MTVVVATREDLTGSDFRKLLGDEWEELKGEQETAPATTGARRQLLMLSLAEVFDIEKAEPRSMGLALSGAAFLIATTIASKLVDVALAAGAHALLDEILRRIRQKRGDGYVTLPADVPSKDQ